MKIPTREDCNMFRRFFGRPHNMFNTLHGFDIIGFENYLADKDKDYQPNTCKYKGQVVSMSEYIAIKYGKEAEKLIERLI